MLGVDGSPILSNAAFAELKLTAGQGRRFGIYPSQHSIDRYRIHHQYASKSDVILAVLYGLELTSPEALHITGDRECRARDANFILAPDFRGMFIMMEKCTTYRAAAAAVSPRMVVVTYIRIPPGRVLSLRQRYMTRMQGPFSARHVSNYSPVGAVAETK